MSELLRIVMFVRDNCPQKIGAFTDETQAFDFLDELASEYAWNEWKDVTEDQHEGILDSLFYSLEGDNGGLVVMQVVCSNKVPTYLT